MKILQLDFFMKDEYVKELKETVGEAFANVLIHASPRTEDKIKKFGNWSRILARGEPLELDDVDVASLRKFVVTDPNMHVILKEPLLDAFDELE